MPTADARWWLFIHQIPPKPDYLRVKIGRRLARIGAIGLKNTVYVLPRTESCREDLQWVFREIREGGGDAMLFAADAVEGLTDPDVEGLFRTARNEDYAVLAEEGRALIQLCEESSSAVSLPALARLQRQADEVAAIDFFAAAGRTQVAELLTSLRTRLTPGVTAPVTQPQQWQGRTWVTRQGIQVDRIACAWLICRFIDAQAQFKFVPPLGHTLQPGEVRFDMYDAEFTHEGDKCSFEVLVERMGLSVPGLSQLAEIIHDIDVKDGKFARPESPGVAAFLRGLALAWPEDQTRLARGSAYLDDLLGALASG